MSEEIIFKSFSIERRYPTTTERVFRAHSDPVKRRRWFAEGKGFTIFEYSLDFRVGGLERTRFRFGDGPPMTYDGNYLEIIEGRRIVLSYAMTIGGAPLSSSLAAVELFPEGDQTLLRFTEHTAFTNGRDDSTGRREGTEQLLESLANELKTND